MENKKGFARNHHDVAFDPNITFRDYWVYGALQAFRNGRTGRCYPSNAKLIQRAHRKIGLTALYESICRLEKVGWLIVKRRKGNSSYFQFPLLPLRPSEGGAVPQRMPPHRSSAYKQEVVTKKYIEPEWQPPMEDAAPRTKSAASLMRQGMDARKKALLDKVTMDKRATPNDFDEYGETTLREDTTDND